MTQDQKNALEAVIVEINKTKKTVKFMTIVEHDHGDYSMTVVQTAVKDDNLVSPSSINNAGVIISLAEEMGLCAPIRVAGSGTTKTIKNKPCIYIF